MLAGVAATRRKRCKPVCHSKGTRERQNVDSRIKIRQGPYSILRFVLAKLQGEASRTHDVPGDQPHVDKPDVSVSGMTQLHGNCRQEIRRTADAVVSLGCARLAGGRVV
jgi:hypothetical protein